MKVVLLSSALCLLLGFFLGRTGRVEKEEEVARPVVKSRRMIPGSSGRSKRTQGGQKREDEFRTLTDQISALSDDPVSKARWQAWILQLRAEEIPEAREILLARERTGRGYEIGENEGGVGDEMLLLLARWYELEGEGALAWVRGQKIWTKGESLKAEITTITDGFHRDPRRGFELSLEWLARVKISDEQDSLGSGIGRAGFRDLILYQVGRWGDDPAMMLEQVDADGELRVPYQNSRGMPFGLGGGIGGGGHGFPVTPGDERGYSDSPAMKAFAEGLVASGRMELAKKLSRALEGGAKVAFEEVFLRAAETRGWQEVKREIDAGLIEFSHRNTESVLDEMILEDRDKAIAWYLDLPRDGEVTRAEVIRGLIDYSDAFQKTVEADPEDPFSSGKALDHDQVEAFLIDLEKRGEPVGEAWLTMAASAAWTDEFERVESYREHLSREQWLQLEERMINVSIRVNQEHVNGESLQFASFRSEDEARIKRFGLMEEVQARITKANSETRVKLQKMVEDLENLPGN